MTTIRKLCCNDLLRISSVNLDYFTITRELSIYLKWMSVWSNYSYSHIAVAPGNRIMGYILGTVKEDDESGHWRGLAMAVSVAPQYRRQKLATELMRLFEKQMVEKILSSSGDDHYYMFLYVGVLNITAQRFFTKIGFKVLTTVSEFYSKSKNHENAYVMSKEIDEERLPRFMQSGSWLCRACREAKRETCSYACLPYIE